MWAITYNSWLRALIWDVIVLTYKQSPLAFLTMLLNLAIFGWLYADVWVLCCGIPIGIIFAFNTFVYVRIKRKIWLTGVLLSSFNALILALWTFNVYSNHGASIPLTTSHLLYFLLLYL